MTGNVFKRRMVVAVAAFAMASAAHAAIIPIFNTGVDASGVSLPDGTLGDPHYILLTVPGGTTDIRVRTSVGLFPIPPWIADSGISAWIGPNNPNDANPASTTRELDGPVGHYDYQTTFDLSGFAAATASLSGRWAMDNEGIDILINGVSTGNAVLDPALSGDPFTTFTAFTINTGFVAGMNTLDFIVNNASPPDTKNPTGLRVEISGTAAAVPEPSSLALFGAGFAGLGVLRRRLAKKQ